jgi:hypothetical protein
MRKIVFVLISIIFLFSSCVTTHHIEMSAKERTEFNVVGTVKVKFQASLTENEALLVRRAQAELEKEARLLYGTNAEVRDISITRSSRGAQIGLGITNIILGAVLFRLNLSLSQPNMFTSFVSGATIGTGISGILYGTGAIPVSMNATGVVVLPKSL